MIRPLEDRVLVKMEEVPETTKSGIILSTKNNEKPQTAIVVEVGPGIKIDGKLEPLEIKKGNRVIVNKYAGTEVTYNDEQYVILRDNDVLAIIEED